jgi:hypothetical protein
MSILNVNNLVPISGSLEVGSVVAAGCSAGNMTVSGNYNANGLVTLANGAVFDSPVVCSVTPSASQHLANKLYTDALLNNSSGKLVYYKTFTGGEIKTWNYAVQTTVVGNANLPDGSYKLYAEGFFTMNTGSSNIPDGVNPYFQAGNMRAIIAFGICGYYDQREIKSGYYSSGGGCGGIGTVRCGGAVGIVSPTITLRNNAPQSFNVTCVRSDVVATAANFSVSAIKVYIFSV